MFSGATAMPPFRGEKHLLELGIFVAVMLAAFPENFRHKAKTGGFLIQKSLNGTQLVCCIPGIFLLNAVNEVLEIVTVPFFSQAFRNFNAVPTGFLPVFRQLVDTSPALTQIVAADELEVAVINVELDANHLVFHCGVGILPGNGIPAGLVCDIWHGSYIVFPESIG